MLKSMINPDLSGKKLSLISGILLTMFLAMSTSLMATDYAVIGAGTAYPTAHT